MGTKPPIVYEDFEPFWKRHTEEEKDILEIDLKGFKKEQLKVQTNNKGALIVQGERAVDGSKGSRFNKEFGLPNECNVSEIRARLSHGVLSIVMPKRVQRPLPEQTQKENICGAVGAAKDARNEQQVLGLEEKDPIWEVKISKKRAIRVAVIIVVAVTLVAIGTQIAKLVHTRPHEAHH